MFLVLRLKKQVPQLYGVTSGLSDQDIESWRQNGRLEPGDVIVEGKIFGTVEEQHGVVIKRTPETT